MSNKNLFVNNIIFIRVFQSTDNPQTLFKLSFAITWKMTHTPRPKVHFPANIFLISHFFWQILPSRYCRRTGTSNVEIYKHLRIDLRWTLKLRWHFLTFQELMRHSMQPCWLHPVCESFCQAPHLHQQLHLSRRYL